MLELWTDVGYLASYGKQNGIADVADFVETILENVERIEDFLADAEKGKRSLGQFFGALDLKEERRRG